VGGHSAEGAELSLGLTVTGSVGPTTLAKSGLRPGDRLLLTKPLGTGVIMAGQMRGKAPSDWLSPVLASMDTSNAEALDILLQVANGMAAAHNQDVIHRDLKPSNILMNEAGLVKIVDFGIASATSNTDATLTKTGSIIGTPAYLSPERAKGLDADHRSDIYALGIIAYAMFTGQLPYTGEPMSLLFQHLEGKAVPIHEIRKELGPRVSLLVQRMMAVELEDRLQTMEDVAETIKEVQHKER